MLTTQSNLYQLLIDEVCEINLKTRTINIPSTKTFVGVENDTDVNALAFKLSSSFNGTSLEDFTFFVNYINANAERDSYEVTDAALVDGEITFTWTLSRKATSYRGNLSFIICAKKFDTDGTTVLKSINTTVSSVKVLKGIESSEHIAQQYADLMEQWKNDIIASVGGDINEAVKNYMTENPVSLEVKDGSITPEKTTFFTSGSGTVASRNLLDESKVTSGAVVYTTGSISQNTAAYPHNWSHSDYIDCSGKSYLYAMAYDKTAGKFKTSCNSLAFYDSTKTFISGEANVMRPISIPSNASYVICSWMLDYYEKLFVSVSDSSSETFEYVAYSSGTTSTGAKIKSEYIDFPTTLSSFTNDCGFITDNETTIVCKGDSLTAGANVTDVHYAYPYQLSQLIKSGNTVINMGRGGDTTMKIGARSGAYPLFVEPFTLPADTSSVEITFKTFAGVDISNTSVDTGINPCYVDGIKCNITYNTNSSKFYISRVEAGDSKSFDRPVQLITNAYKNYRKCITILWSGTNDSALTIDEIIQQQRTILNDLQTEKYLVLSLTAKSVFSDIEDRNKALAKEYGRRFVNVREYLLEYGLEDAGLSATPQDTTDISNGEIPVSLRSDTIHLNDKSYPIVAKCVYLHGKGLGYWK